MAENTDFNKIPVPRRSIYSVVIKRLLDIVLSLIALIILSPILLVVVVLELVFHGKPIHYNSLRPGKDCKPFKLLKFRTMTNERDENGELLSEEIRLTKFGRILRKLSIDELPQLINILKGDMSIIGPRPLLLSYVDLYTPRHKMRHAVRPGLSCRQVIPPRYPGAWSWGDQFDNDVYYVEHVSFALDLKMIFQSFYAVINAREQRVTGTRPEFDGKNLYD